MQPKRLERKPELRRGPAPTRDWAAIATLLRTDPGTWYEVEYYTANTNEAHRIKTGANPAFREGRWDAMREAVEGGFVLYVCYEPAE